MKRLRHIYLTDNKNHHVFTRKGEAILVELNKDGSIKKVDNFYAHDTIYELIHTLQTYHSIAVKKKNKNKQSEQIFGLAKEWLIKNKPRFALNYDFQFSLFGDIIVLERED